MRQVRELSAQALLGAAPGDAVLLRAEVPRDYLDHLAGFGVAPRVLHHPVIEPDHRLDPFAWTADAMALNRAHEAPTEHPAPDCLRRVNARSFAHELEAELWPDVPQGRTVTSLAELEAFLAAAPVAGEWLVKAEFGNAGLANRRLRRPRLDPVDRRFVEEHLAEDDRLLVEPWLDRSRDFSVVFDVPFDAATARVHETVYTRDGAPIGALFGPASSRGDVTPRPPTGLTAIEGELAEGSSDALERWRAPLIHVARQVAARLTAEGYFGPVCIDAFTWRDGGVERLRPLADLNARRAMSDYAYAFWRRHAVDGWLYYRFYNQRKFALPSDVRALKALLAGFDDGVWLASPPTVTLGGREVRPGKLAVMLVGPGREQVLELDRAFRERYEV